MSNPYRSKPDHQYWRRAISGVEPHAIDPVTSTKFKIAPSDRVVTAGSCFAQHISRHLSEIGFHYHVPEAGLHLQASERARRGYGMFSARYGNLYTARQLLQLFQEAFGQRPKSESAWLRPDGRYVDPFRPQIEPDGFSTPDDVMRARDEHLESVRRAFLECDVFIFTLGLTESWSSLASGDVFPVAPGVSGGAYDTSLHAFTNYDVGDVLGDMEHFLVLFRSVNASARIVLTVSPVPLIATYEPRHVLVSTVYSKSVLRVAADALCKAHDHVDYFPSYEIITAINPGAYYEDDQREVNPRGVAHAMRCFLANYVNEGASSPKAVAVFDSAVPKDIICDEEAIERI